MNMTVASSDYLNVQQQPDQMVLTEQWVCFGLHECLLVLVCGPSFFSAPSRESVREKCSNSGTAVEVCSFQLVDFCGDLCAGYRWRSSAWPAMSSCPWRRTSTSTVEQTTPYHTACKPHRPDGGTDNKGCARVCELEECALWYLEQDAVSAGWWMTAKSVWRFWIKLPGLERKVKRCCGPNHWPKVHMVSLWRAASRVVTMWPWSLWAVH